MKPAPLSGVVPSRSESDPPGRRWAVWLCVAGFVLSSRAWLANAWGSGVPFWDEWDAEALNLYRPWLTGDLHLSQLFAAHNEHRIVFTRLVDLVFLVAYGRWEPWAQIVLNAILHATVAASCVAIFWSDLKRVARTGLTIAAAVLFSAPAGWQNALHGFQSQVYFANLLAVAAIAGLVIAPPRSGHWWLGWIAAVLGLFCFASGVFASLAALGALIALPAGEPKLGSDWRSIGAIALIPIIAFFLSSQPPQHASLHAHDLFTFIGVTARGLSWPHVNSPILCLVVQSPAVAAVLLSWTGRRPLSTAERSALALALFAALQAAAIAYSRGNGLPEGRPLSRYQDAFVLGAVAQCFLALRLAETYARTGRLFATGWAATVAVGLLSLSTFNLSVNLPYKRAQDKASLTQVREYLKTHDGTVFTRDPLFPGPHPDPDHVKQVLDDPVLRRVLPKIFFTDKPESASGTRPWIIEHGRMLFTFASVSLLVTFAWTLRREPSRAADGLTQDHSGRIFR